MENEIKNDFLSSLEKDLERDLNNLTIEKQEKQEKYQSKITELVKKQLAEAEKKIEKKLKIFYYWLFGIALILLIVVIGILFYLRKSLVGK